MLQPVLRKTWSPRGHTPIQYSWDRRERLSVVSAISVSPIRHRLGLFFSIRGRNIKAADFQKFIESVLAHFQRGVILVLDRWAVHRCAARRLEKRFPRRVETEWLPAYAPELNPVEQVWDRTKYADLANYIPDDVFRLQRAVRRSIRRTSESQSIKRSFFSYSKLRI